jgi:hypothetical protein
MLSRSIKIKYPVEGASENNKVLTFSDILEIPNIVLLGEPHQSVFLHENNVFQFCGTNLRRRKK